MRLTDAAACREDGFSGGSNSARGDAAEDRFHHVAAQ
jgi:hypothetical protein